MESSTRAVSFTSKEQKSLVCSTPLEGNRKLLSVDLLASLNLVWCISFTSRSTDYPVVSIIYRHSNQWNTGKSFHISHFALNISHFVFHILYLTSHISHFAFCISHFAFVFHMFTFRILFFTSSILYFEFHIFYFLFHMSHFVFQMSHCHISHFECCTSYLTFLISRFSFQVYHFRRDLDWRAVFDQACSCRKKHKNDLFLKKLLCCVGGQDTLC